MHMQKSSTPDPEPKANTDTPRPPTTESQLLARESRKDIFQAIHDRTGRTLLCYVGREISEEDVRYLAALLHAVEPGAPLELLLNSPGGSIHTAETSPSAEFRMIVPDQAKSAATLVALGASEIVMSTTSELGPIDPQVSLQDRKGNWIWHFAFDYIEAYKAAEDNYRTQPDDSAHKAVFESLDPVRFRSMEKMVEYTRKCAENLLKRHGGSYTLVPSKLMDRDMFPVHAQVIDWETAQRTVGLKVTYMDDHNPLWRLYWRLYCHLQNAVVGYQKIFESAKVSLLVA